MQFIDVMAGTEQELRREEVGDASRQEVKTMTVVGYARQSGQELQKRKKTIDEQAAKIAAFVRSQEWDLTSMYQDITESGDNLHRPALLEILAQHNFEILIVDTMDRLARTKKDLDFIIAFLDKLDITCVAATWSMDYLAQYVRHYYRTKGNKIYALLDKSES